MTNRQSNIIFYGVISLVIYGIGVNYFYPDFFEDLSKSKEELSIKEAVTEGNYAKALPLYQQLLNERISDNNENTIETANLYEDMAMAHAQLGNNADEKNAYLKSLSIKQQLKQVNPYSVANTYFKLAEIAERDQLNGQAQSYYEQSLATRLGNAAKSDDEGMFEGLQNAQLRYKRLNNPDTIATFKKLAALHAMKQETAIAKDYYEKALAASKETFGEDDPKTLEVVELLKSVQ